MTQHPLMTLLSETEFDLLDRFLLDRIEEDAVQEGDDEGILNISELDGFRLVVMIPVLVTGVKSTKMPPSINQAIL